MSALRPKSRHFALSEQCPLRAISGQFFVNGNELRGRNFSITDGWSICNSTGGAVAFWKPPW
jgi:hypothetical protein